MTEGKKHRLLSDLDKELFEAILGSSKEREQRRREHAELMQSPDFVAATQRLEHITRDLAETLRQCFFIATRHPDLCETSFFLRSIDDLIQSGLMAGFGAHEGYLNPALRELRYMCELAVQSLFVDESMGSAPFETRFEFFNRQVKTRSVEHLRDLSLFLLPGLEDDFRTHVLGAWRAACQYVHPSKQQLSERLDLEKQGVRVGFETTEQLMKTVDAVETASAIVIVLAFHAIGPSFTADLLVDALDGVDSWSFHRDRFVAKIDEQFDYKAERTAGLDDVRRRRGARIGKL